MEPRTRRILVTVATVLLLVAGLSACRNETQNRIRRSIQDFTNVRMYITVYSWTGDPVFEGLVDGKVTRASASSDDGTEAAAGGNVNRESVGRWGVDAAQNDLDITVEAEAWHRRRGELCGLAPACGRRSRDRRGQDRRQPCCRNDVRG